MKKKLGSSQLFVVTAIIFFENIDANNCDTAIEEIKVDCLKSGRSEFKFNKCCHDHRAKFFHAIEGLDFLYVAFVFNKEKMYGPGFQFKEPFYKYCCKLLFEVAKPYLTAASVTIDRSGDRNFRNQLQKYLKAKINTSQETIKKLKAEPSHSNNLLQMADMVCGAVARSFRLEKKNCGHYRKIVSGHEVAVNVWPKF